MKWRIELANIHTASIHTAYPSHAHPLCTKRSKYVCDKTITNQLVLPYYNNSKLVKVN